MVESRWLTVITMLGVLVAVTSALADNSVTVVSDTVDGGSTAVPIRVKITNDVALSALEVPLEIRTSIGGAYITSLKLQFAERLATLWSFKVAQACADPGDASCGSHGYHTVSWSGMNVSHPVAASPEGVRLATIRVIQTESFLTAGADVSGSLVMTVDVTTTPGTFVIDTTCIDPGSHLAFVDAASASPFVPSFTLGVIMVRGAPPVALCQNVTKAADANCAADVGAAEVDNGSYDPDAGQTITLHLVPPGPFAVGATPVQLIVTDEQGLSDTCVATITINDVTPPTLTCPADFTVGTDPGLCGAAVTYEASATDDCPGAIVYSYNPPSGSFFSLGSHAVRAIAVDAAGNADTCSFVVTVKDTEPPVFTCPADTTVLIPLDQSEVAVDFRCSYDDNCGGGVFTCSPYPGSVFPRGTTPVTCIAYDGNGNADTCNFNVTVASLCACDCPADPAPIGSCDGVQDVLDVVQTINVAFRGQAPIPDPNMDCPYQTTDVDCTGETGILDVVHMINVAFRGANGLTEFCSPCGRQIWPLQVGNQWTYEDQILDSAGNVVHRDTTVFLIEKDTVIQGSTWFIASVNGVRSEVSSPAQNRGDGTWAWNGTSAYLVWKYPANVGDSYLMETQTVIVESITAVAIVPAGTFACINYRWPDDGLDGRIYQYHYVSPGIGWVLGEEYYRTTGGFEYPRIRNLLISYTVQ